MSQEIKLSPQQVAEVEFWKWLVAQHGRQYFAYRTSEYYEKIRYFPGFVDEKSYHYGADVGCGCGSVFQAHIGNVDSYDALAREYNKILSGLDPYSLMCEEEPYIKPMADFVGIGTQIEVQHKYDWVACINMIDHDPNPEAVIRQIHAALKPGGRLYFEVNFERGIAPPHYMVFDEAMVDKILNPNTGFERRHKFIQDVPEHNQKRYWSEYIKI